MNPPPGYENKFAEFIRLCSDAKAKGTEQIVIGYACAPLPACRGADRSLIKHKGIYLPGFPGSAFAGESLLDSGGPFRVRRAQAIEQPIRADFQILGNPCERCHRERKITVFERANGLHMHTRQLGQAFLSQTRLEASLTNVSPQYTQNFAVVHSH